MTTAAPRDSRVVSQTPTTAVKRSMARELAAVNREPADNVPRTIDIDPLGDLYLEVSNLTRLRVSTKILTSASTVFAAMLGNKFAEGQQTFTTEQPGVVLLHDDDGIALCVDLCILHHQSQRPGEDFDWGSLLAMCQIADKYDFMAAVQPVVESSLAKYLVEKICCKIGDKYNLQLAVVPLLESALEFEKSCCRHTAWSIVATAALISDEIQFRRLTKDIMLYFSCFEVPQAVVEALPQGISDMIFYHAHKCRSELISNSHKLVSRLLANAVSWTIIKDRGPGLTLLEFGGILRNSSPTHISVMLEALEQAKDKTTLHFILGKYRIIAQAACSDNVIYTDERSLKPPSKGYVCSAVVKEDFCEQVSVMGIVKQRRVDIIGSMLDD